MSAYRAPGRSYGIGPLIWAAILTAVLYGAACGSAEPSRVDVAPRMDPVVACMAGWAENPSGVTLSEASAECGVPLPCSEDSPCWDCETMGNRVCGPALPDPPGSAGR